MRVTFFSPAKINLFLAVTGRRSDGFHNLVSIVTPLDFGDHLEATLKEPGDGPRFTMECDQPELAIDSSNLVLRAADAFAVATGWKGLVHFRLMKKIPIGAGLGGGSSNAVAALRAMNQLAGNPLDGIRLAEIAATLGSDCTLFLHNGPVVIRGRGDRIQALAPEAAAVLRGRLVCLFKPSFGVPTPWAYQRMIARRGDYISEDDAERRVAAWIRNRTRAEELLFNNMQPAVFEKYVTLPVMLDRMRSHFGIPVLMSGSGSACFTVLEPADKALLMQFKAYVRDAWGSATFVQEARLA